MDVYAIVYKQHCCKCPLRNDDCHYEKCSPEQFETWVKEAKENKPDKA